MISAISDTVALVKSRGGVAFGYVCDITDREMVYKMARTVEKEVGKVCVFFL